jgi:hypothetical protein
VRPEYPSARTVAEKRALKGEALKLATIFPSSILHRLDALFGVILDAVDNATGRVSFH